MDKPWGQVLAAMLLGLMLPHVFLGFGGNAQQDQPQPTTEATAPTATYVQEQGRIQIPVQIDNKTVQVMELEDYILGVVLAEMPASFEEEALKAQAVVARTYALRRMTLADRHSGCAICTDSSCCQAYISPEDYLQHMGIAEDIEKLGKAVQDTAGLVLTYNGKLAEATYFSCSGGRTEGALAVWGEQIPYLQAVDSPGEEKSDSYSQTKSFTPAQLAAALGRSMEGKPENWLGKVTYTQGDGVDMMFIGGVGYSGVELRKYLGLNSTAFTITVEEGCFTVQTRGKGHRVGMSQYGADAMAATGKSYKEILSHYYQGTRIDKFPLVG